MTLESLQASTSLQRSAIPERSPITAWRRKLGHFPIKIQYRLGVTASGISKRIAKLVPSQYQSYMEREIARLTRLTCHLSCLALCRRPYVVAIMCSEEN